MGQWCRLFKLCQSLPPGYFGTGVQAVNAVFETTSMALWPRVQAV